MNDVAETPPPPEERTMDIHKPKPVRNWLPTGTGGS